ncbi:MAG: RNA polymerase sigma factor [Candidatus Cyclobacteriaceae bacterium M3_2C_046]
MILVFESDKFIYIRSLINIFHYFKKKFVTNQALVRLAFEMSLKDFKNRVLPVKNKLYRFAFSYMKDHDEAKDVVQEVFLKIWNKKEEMHTYVNMEAWCMRMVRNLCLDKLKSNYRKSEQLGKESYEMPGEMSTPYQELEKNDTLSKIKGYLHQLPEKQQKVMHLRDIEGYTYQEISEILGLDLNQVKVNLFRARKTIREKIINTEAYGL